MLVALLLVIIAVMGLCQVTGITGKWASRPPAPTTTSTPMPTSTPPPNLTTVPTAMPTATPTSQPQLMPGGRAVVQGTGTQQLRLRTGPGLDQETLCTLPDDTKLTVVEGPEIADGYRWWKVQTDDGLVGWVAGDWLVPIAP